MSQITKALESAVAAVIANRTVGGDRPSARQRAEADKAFAAILKLIAPRIRHFIRQYGLAAHWEDAEQCCAIAVPRAIGDYDPNKAQFTTFVNWQLRGELQSLRFRLMTDQRPSAQKVGARTVSLSSLGTSSEGEDISIENLVEDEDALDRTLAGASDYLATRATQSLMQAYLETQRAEGIAQLQRRPVAKRSLATQSAEERAALRRLRSRNFGLDPADLVELDQRLARDSYVIQRRFFEADRAEDTDMENWITKERVRQVSKRAGKVMEKVTMADPRFRVMQAYSRRTAA
ncbi:MAG: sigma-70 family RNA polymerase sigma factor [Sandaracinobacter sp.]